MWKDWSKSDFIDWFKSMNNGKFSKYAQNFEKLLSFDSDGDEKENFVQESRFCMNSWLKHFNGGKIYAMRDLRLAGILDRKDCSEIFDEICKLQKVSGIRILEISGICGIICFFRVVKVLILTL